MCPVLTIQVESALATTRQGYEHMRMCEAGYIYAGLDVCLLCSFVNGLIRFGNLLHLPWHVFGQTFIYSITTLSVVHYLSRT